MPDQKEVTISLKRYDQSASIEARVGVLVQRAIREGFMNLRDMLWIIGTDEAVEFSRELERREEFEHAERMEKYGELCNG